MKISSTFRRLTLVLAVILSLTFSAHALEVISVSVTPKPAESANYAPIAENLSFTTYKDVAVHGEFAAVDPEGDVISFRVASQPRKGTVEVNGTGFVYSPDNGKKGRDRFTYVAVDSNGNVSDESTVDILIEKLNVKVSYSDMDGNDAHYAALRLAEEGIYTGEQIGSEYYFDPDEILSRGEFLTLCLNTIGLEPLEGITRTGFSDDADIPAWEKAYISTALMAGVVQGYSTAEGKIVFASTDEISCAEAMVMLNNSLKISNVSSASSLDAEALPAWAAQAAANLSACSIISPSISNYNSPLTRGNAAKMLCSSLDLLAERESNKGSLLSWAW